MCVCGRRSSPPSSYYTLSFCTIGKFSPRTPSLPYIYTHIYVDFFSSARAVIDFTLHKIWSFVVPLVHVCGYRAKVCGMIMGPRMEFEPPLVYVCVCCRYWGQCHKLSKGQRRNCSRSKYLQS